MECLNYVADKISKGDGDLKSIPCHFEKPQHCYLHWLGHDCETCKHRQ